MIIEVFKHGTQWYWQIIASNGKVIGGCDYSYSSQKTALNMARKVAGVHKVIAVKY